MTVPTFRDFVSGPWTAECYCRCKPSTRQRMDSVLRTQLIPNFGDSPLDQIARSTVQQWFDHYSRTAPAGANRALDVLRQVLNHAVTSGILVLNPTRGMRHNPRPTRTRFLSRQELVRLHVALDAHQGRGSGQQQVEIIRLLLLTGCRKGELVNLHWAQIDGDVLHLRDSKTGPRSVFLNAQAQAVLARQSRTASPHVFPALNDLSRCRSSELSVWRKVRREAGIEDVRLHDLRHSFASHAVMQCVPLPVVSRLLGHTRAQMTLRYAHVSDRETEAAAERIGIAIAALLAEPRRSATADPSEDRDPNGRFSQCDESGVGEPDAAAGVECHVPCYSPGITIAHNGLELFFERGDCCRIPSRLAPDIRRILSDLEAATSPEDMDLPGYSLQALTDDRRERWSVRISARRHLVFNFAGGSAIGVNLLDHHG